MKAQVAFLVATCGTVATAFIWATSLSVGGIFDAAEAQPAASAAAQDEAPAAFVPDTPPQNSGVTLPLAPGPQVGASSGGAATSTPTPTPARTPVRIETR